jgi:hypothetical protein
VTVHLRRRSNSQHLQQNRLYKQTERSVKGKAQIFAHCSHCLDVIRKIGLFLLGPCLEPVVGVLEVINKTDC